MYHYSLAISGVCALIWLITGLSIYYAGYKEDTLINERLKPIVVLIIRFENINQTCTYCCETAKKREVVDTSQQLLSMTIVSFLNLHLRHNSTLIQIVHQQSLIRNTRLRTTFRHIITFSLYVSRTH